jgi:ankyrin repeat protein
MLNFLLLLNHCVSVDITGIDGRIPLRAAACNDHLEANRQLLSNGCSVHIVRKCELTALLAAADSGNVEVFCELLKHSACVVIVIKKCSELLKAAAEKKPRRCCV